MTSQEMRFQVALSCIQGVLEAKHGIFGEIVPSVAVKESLRIADEFVKQWFGDTIVDRVEEDVKEWSELDKLILDSIVSIVEDWEGQQSEEEKEYYGATQKSDWLKSLPLNLKKKSDDVAKLCSNEWSEEDEKILERFLGWLQGTMGEKTYSSWLKSLRERFNLQPKQESEVDGLEEEIERFLASEESTTYVPSGKFTTSYKDPKKIARHFAEWGAIHLKK